MSLDQYDVVYINGDSYCATSESGFSDCFVDPNDSSNLVFSDYLQQHFPNTQFINNAIAGSNNDRIFRSSIEHILDLVNKNKSVFVIIGFSFCSRHEVVYKGNNQSLTDVIHNHMCRDFNNIKYPLTTLDRILHDDPSVFHQTQYDNLDRTQQVLEFCNKLIMFAGWCKSLGVEYFLFSGSNNTDVAKCNWDVIKNTQAYNNIQNDKCIHNIFNFCIPHYAQQNNFETTSSGHLLQNGHENFAKYLLEHIK